MRKLRYVLNDFKWLKVLNSPFKPLSVKWYIGKTQIGVPYFFPRKLVKYTHADVIKAVEKHLADKNKAVASYERLYDMYKGYTKFVPLTVGFDYCSLGWKTKWTNTDFRYEWGPVFTFVFFGYQIALMVGHEHPSHYWECWLYYEYATDKTKSKYERIAQCRKEFPQTWTSNKEGTIDYYTRILKPKYLL